MLPLSGLRILDFTRLLPGPYATRLLAELGADVIKVEDPNGGDPARWMPPLTGDPPMSGLFAELNRGKRSLTLDLRRPEAQAAAGQLALGADVLIDSFRPGGLAKYGLDPGALMSANPRLVYCAMTGFGLTGPDAGRAGHDIGYCARSGVLGLSGTVETPAVSGVQVADIGGAMTAVAGILAALLGRAKTGQGQVVDVSLSEASMGFATAAFATLHAGGRPRRGHELLDGSRPCYGVYRTRDGEWLAVGALELKFWSAFVRAIGLSELEGCGWDAGEGGERVKRAVAARIAERDRAAWEETFRSVDACVEPVLRVEEVASDVQHRARGVVMRGDGRGQGGEVGGGYLRSPIRLVRWAQTVEGGGPVQTPEVPEGTGLRRAPSLGEHTESVLREAGLGEELVSSLTSEAVAAAGDPPRTGRDR